MFNLKNLVLSLVLSSLTAMGAVGQTGPVAGGGNGSPGIAANPVNPTPAAGTLASVDVLNATLQKLGTNVRNLGVDNQGWTTYVLDVQKDGIRYPLFLQVNNGYMFISVNLGNVMNLSAVSPTLLEQVFALGHPIGPSYFRIAIGANGVKVLQLAHRVDRNITPERLANAFNEFIGDIKTSEKVWMQLVQR